MLNDNSAVSMALLKPDFLPNPITCAMEAHAFWNLIYVEFNPDSGFTYVLETGLMSVTGRHQVLTSREKPSPLTTPCRSHWRLLRAHSLELQVFWKFRFQLVFNQSHGTQMFTNQREYTACWLIQRLEDSNRKRSATQSSMNRALCQNFECSNLNNKNAEHSFQKAYCHFNSQVIRHVICFFHTSPACGFFILVKMDPCMNMSCLTLCLSAAKRRIWILTKLISFESQ